MNAQLDLTFEGKNLLIFRKNFENMNEIMFPKPFLNYTVDTVLVETFEYGEPISKYLNEKYSINKKIASIGINAYMKMMLIDHFIHADLHPGNILVKLNRDNDQVQLIFLDCGLVNALSPTDAEHFVSLFKAIVEGNGKLGTELMIQHSRIPPKWSSPESEEVFKSKMSELFESVREKKLSEIEVGPFLSKILHLMRTYHVKVNFNFFFFL